MLVVLDIETTGLDPQHDDILEVAAILLDQDDNATEEFYSRVAGDGSKANDFVMDMHTKGGLWEALAAVPPKSATEVDKALAGWLLAYSPPKETFVLVGRSVHFDASFLQAQFPLTASLLSHRRRDTSALEKILREWGVKVPDEPPTAHRALSDARASLAQYQAMKAEIGRLVGLAP